MFRLSALVFLIIVIIIQNEASNTIMDIQSSILRASEVGNNFLDAYDRNLPKDKVVQFYCANYTDKVFTQVYFDDPDIARKVNISNRFAFIVHGWTDTGNESWMIEVANTWIQYYDTNVCRIGWDKYASAEYVTAATQNVKLVAGYVTSFLRSLHDNFSVPYDTITIAGHSLGAHLAGGVGSNLGGSELKRIIGMDPAGPLFTNPFEVAPDYRLDKSDAQEVIIIHTTDGVLGLGVPGGHQDFYPDRGVSVQPGCLFEYNGGYGTHTDSLSCSHIRAVRIFHNSLVPGNECVAMKCDGVWKYLFNSFDGIVAQIGPYTEITAEGQFFMKSDLHGRCTGSY